MYPSVSALGLVTFLVFSTEIFASVPVESTLNICDSIEEVTLPDTGLESFNTIDLKPIDTVRNSQCTLKITAPDTHLVNLRFQENDIELYRLMSSRHKHNRPCKLSIYLQDVEDKLWWSGDICSLEKLPDVDLITPKIKLVWEAADNTFHAKGRKIIVNTVGTGDYCERPDQHVCMRIGWKPSLCISNQLLCDNRDDCPKGSPKSDEDEEFCKEYVRKQSTWKQMVVNIYKKVKDNYDVDKILEQFDFTTPEPGLSDVHDNYKKVVQFKNWKEIRQLEVTTSAPHAPPPKTLLGFIISQYGPWGYVLIAVLLFGTTLVFWGMWECCIRKHRAEHDVIAASQLNSPTTAVLIVNGYEDPHTVQPPDYDDLDLPPSYAALFPHEDKTTDGEDEDDDEGRAETIPLDSIRHHDSDEEAGNT